MGTAKKSILELARFFNNFYFRILENRGCVSPLRVEGRTIGLVSHQVRERLLSDSNWTVDGACVQLSVEGRAERSEVVGEVLRRWREEKLFVALEGWREENYEVKHDSGYSKDTISQSLFEMERSATCLFGIRQYGVDINGYVRHPERGLCLWLQKRADDKPTWPGMLDNMVGGGLATNYSVLETALKEASEEAGIGGELLKKLRPCGTVSFFFESERGLFPNTEFVFDLELPVEFVPKNMDGEVQEFCLVDVGTALSHCLSPSFKTTSCPVTLDFLVRHGVINADSEPMLPELLPLLHVNLTDLYRSFD